jgi:hypothetical protein
MPSAGGVPTYNNNNGVNQSDCHHSSGGINSQRQCAQQASLVTGLKEFRNRKNQVRVYMRRLGGWDGGKVEVGALCVGCA